MKKVTIESTALQAAFKPAAGAVARVSALPVLSSVLISAKGNQLTIMGTDLQSQVRTITTLAKPVEMDISAAVDARKLSSILATLPQEQITLSFEESKVHITAGRSRLSIKTQPEFHFPLMDQSQQDPVVFELPQKALHAMLAAVEHAAPTSDTRHYLNGVFWQSAAQEDGVILHLVATDGHRLATTSIAMPQGLTSPVEFILPKKAVSELLRTLDPKSESLVRVSLSKALILFDLPQVQITSKLVDGRFPDWKRVVPPMGPNPVSLPIDLVTASLARIRLADRSEHTGATIEVQGNVLRIHNDHVDASKQENAVDEEIELVDQGDPINGVWNPGYVMDLLQSPAAGSGIRVSHPNPEGALIFDSTEHHNFRSVLMKMRA